MSTENLDSEYPDILTSHDYDGIQEYDNPMPFWWKAIFVLSVIWAVFYVAGIELGMINTYEENLSAEEVVLADIKATQTQDLPPVDEAMLLAAAGDDGALAAGEKVYTATCASCHGDKGQGLIGPNLTDKFWLHGGSISEIHHVVVNGVTEKGMPAWGPVIGRDGAMQVTAFIHARLRGTNVEGKAPQGDAYEAEGGADVPEAAEAPGAPGGDEAVPAVEPAEGEAEAAP